MAPFRSSQYCLFLFVAAFVVVVCCGACDRRRETVEPKKVRVAYPSGFLPALYHVALAKGFFSAEGLEIEDRPCTYGKAALQSVVDGKADLAIAGETPFVFSATGGRKLSILAVVASTEKFNAIVARKDRGIEKPDDLKGKRLGASFGTTGHFFLDSFLSVRGIGTNEVTIVDVQPGDAARKAIFQGEVDAISYWSYFAGDMLQKLGDKGTIFYDRSLYSDRSVIIATQAFVRGYPETVNKILRALLKAEAFMRQNPGESRRIVAELARADMTLLDEAWDTLDFRVVLDQALLVSLEDQTRWAQRNEFVPPGPMPNYLDYIFIDGLQSLRPEAVKIIR